MRDDRAHRSRLIDFDRSCPSGKRGYTSKAKARKALRQCGNRGAPLEAYRCSIDGCDRWHLTSKRSY